jgi:hypothetical protein
MTSRTRMIIDPADPRNRSHTVASRVLAHTAAPQQAMMGELPTPTRMVNIRFLHTRTRLHQLQAIPRVPDSRATILGILGLASSIKCLPNLHMLNHQLLPNHTPLLLRATTNRAPLNFMRPLPRKAVIIMAMIDFRSRHSRPFLHASVNVSTRMSVGELQLDMHLHLPLNLNLNLNHLPHILQRILVIPALTCAL